MSELLIKNPATGEQLDKIARTTNLEEVYDKARRARLKWQNQPLKYRIKVLQAFKEKLLKRADKLAREQTLETGKPISQSRGEINAVTRRIDYFCGKVTDVIKKEKVYEEPTLLELISYEPLGVIANISAWNYPWFVGLNVIVPALLTGNAVLYKPSEFAVLTGLNICRFLEEAGLPENLLSCVVGEGDVGAQLVDLPIDGLFFTGSYNTGKKIAETIAPRFIKSAFELGGKDPVYVADDVHVDTAVAGTADGAFYNLGQSCCAIERIYVHEKIAHEFIEKFTAQVKQFKVGDPLDEQTYLGPLTREAHARYLDEQVGDAQNKNARPMIATGALPAQGAYYAPQVFTDVNHDMLLMKEETFGPLIGIQVVKSDEEAINLMKDTQYGLTAGVYTNFGERANQILSEMNSGTVYWNCCDRVSPYLPWSGRGHSGLGSTLSHLGILAFVKPKAWHLKKPEG